MNGPVCIIGVLVLARKHPSVQMLLLFFHRPCSLRRRALPKCFVSGQHFRDTGHQQLRYTFDVCLENYVDQNFSAQGFAKYPRQDIPPPPPPPFTLPSSFSSSGVAPVGETMVKDKKKEVQQDVDMMSTTVGGTTVQGSTGDVPEGESSDDGLEKLTHRSDSPRLTNSSGHKQRRLERFLEYNETNVVVAGEKFEIVDVDQRKKALPPL